MAQLFLILETVIKAILDSNSNEEKIRQLEMYLLRHFEINRPFIDCIDYAATSICEQFGMVKIEELVKESFVSRRTLNTLFFHWCLGRDSLAQLAIPADIKYSIDHLMRTRDELLEATQVTTKAQWNFKEDENRWSIAQVVQHTAIWEVFWSREISI